MQVRKICSLGYFDKIYVDGYMMPMYNNKGIEINENESLAESIENNKQSYNQGIGKLKINIYGIVNDGTSSIEDEERMSKVRNELGLIPIKIGKSIRYSIGYAEIYILKSDYSFPKNVTKTGKTEDDINKLAKDEDEFRIMLQALKTQHDIIIENKGIDDCNIAIINRVYVNREFRNCGISKWLHSNLGDITKIYGMIDIAAALLIPGDFADEAQKYFNMSKNKYVNFLNKHYKSLGYKQVTKDILCKKLIQNNIRHTVRFKTKFGGYNHGNES